MKHTYKLVKEKSGREDEDEFLIIEDLESDNPVYWSLEKLIELGIIKDLETNFFKTKFILNSISALDNKPSKPNFSAYFC